MSKLSTVTLILLDCLLDMPLLCNLVSSDSCHEMVVILSRMAR